MKREKISEAVQKINLRHIEEAVEYEIEEKKKKQKNKAVWLKWASVAACFSLIIAITAMIIPHINRDDIQGQSPDITYAQYINGFLYQPIFNPESLYEKYPELKNITEPVTTGYRYHLSAHDLGEFFGTVPAHEKAHLPEGKAYHWLAYPHLESIIIVEREGKYSLYHFDGLVLPEDDPNISSSILGKYNLPKMAISVEIPSEGITITNSGKMTELCSILANKQHDSAYTYRDLVWEAWQSERGDVGVFYDGTDFTYTNAEIQKEFSAFFGRNIKTLVIHTANGFEITVRIDVRFHYFILNNKTFCISRAETEQFKDLIDLVENMS